MARSKIGDARIKPSFGGKIIATIPANQNQITQFTATNKAGYCVEAYLDGKQELRYHVHDFDERGAKNTFRNPVSNDQSVTHEQLKNGRFGAKFLYQFSDRNENHLWEYLLKESMEQLERSTSNSDYTEIDYPDKLSTIIKALNLPQTFTNIGEIVDSTPSGALKRDIVKSSISIRTAMSRSNPSQPETRALLEEHTNCVMEKHGFKLWPVISGTDGRDLESNIWFPKKLEFLKSKDKPVIRELLRRLIYLTASESDDIVKTSYILDIGLGSPVRDCDRTKDTAPARSANVERPAEPTEARSRSSGTSGQKRKFSNIASSIEDPPHRPCKPDPIIWVGNLHQLKEGVDGCLSFTELIAKYSTIQRLKRDVEIKEVYCHSCTTCTTGPSIMRRLKISEKESVWIHPFSRDDAQLFILLKWKPQEKAYVPWLRTNEYSNEGIIESKQQSRAQEVDELSSSESVEDDDSHSTYGGSEKHDMSHISDRQSSKIRKKALKTRPRQGRNGVRPNPGQFTASVVVCKSRATGSNGMKPLQEGQGRVTPSIASRALSSPTPGASQSTRDAHPEPPKGAGTSREQPVTPVSAPRARLAAEVVSDSEIEFKYEYKPTQFLVDLVIDGTTTAQTGFSIAKLENTRQLFREVKRNLDIEEDIDVLKVHFENSGRKFPIVSVRAGNETAFGVLCKNIETYREVDRGEVGDSRIRIVVDFKNTSA